MASENMELRAAHTSLFALHELETKEIVLADPLHFECFGVVLLQCQPQYCKR